MSAGRYTRGKYECDDGSVCPARFQPETAAADFGGTVNAEPAGAVDMNQFATLRKGRREYGIGTRKVCIAWTAAPPAGYDERGCLDIPVLTKAVYDAISIFSTGNYLGAAFQVISKSPEFIR